nr:HPP family protein [Pigmentiphaga humi]
MPRHPHPAWAAFRAWLLSFRPSRVRINGKERCRIIAGAAVGVVLAALSSRWAAGGGLASAWMVAPLGASAVLVFAVPASPLAQPWPVIGGNTVSALVGVACASWIGDPALAGAAAVACAIALMLALRCLHPPGGAAALTAVLVHATSFHFAFFPVLVNSLLLVTAGLVYNTLTGRRYPHTQAAAPAVPHSRFTAADLDAALAHYNQVLDVSRDDLQELLHFAEMSAYRRTLGELRCQDIMTPQPLTASHDTSLKDAWQRMQARRIKALPVVDRHGDLAGIATVADFMRQLDQARPQGLTSRLKALAGLGGPQAGRQGTIGQIMTRRVTVASADRYVIELIPLFAHGGHHHIPIVDGGRRLVGIITQTDLVKALAKAVDAGREG